MKVLDLQCAMGHRFEGWFGSEDDYQQQDARGLVTCPVCGIAQVSKCLSAPRLNLKAGAEADRPPVKAQEANPDRTVPAVTTPAPQLDPEKAAHLAVLHAAWREMAQRMKAQSENVGDRFADEARKIHDGEAEERAIHGRATLEQAQELLEDGIAVLPLPPDDTDPTGGQLH